ncbi:MerR family transcriptional regulator [Streptomyces sp. NBC_01198]|uniref:MerR family transcriptional regulator n=1 Tax=Streptomyces sp. NBC_01198 TaxID=2903769 RepID=UPI002E10B837|nr:MerR family transcriptional regulator [Streptomyces sp. NBC_01198]
MRIGELSTRTDTPHRLLRYYEEQGLIVAGRLGNGYRDYDEACVDRVIQVRGLLDAGLPTRIIRVLSPATPPWLRCLGFVAVVVRDSWLWGCCCWSVASLWAVGCCFWGWEFGGGGLSGVRYLMGGDAVSGSRVLMRWRWWLGV